MFAQLVANISEEAGVIAGVVTLIVMWHRDPNRRTSELVEQLLATMDYEIQRFEQTLDVGEEPPTRESREGTHRATTRQRHAAATRHRATTCERQNSISGAKREKRRKMIRVEVHPEHRDGRAPS